MRALFYRAKRISSTHLYDKACDQIVQLFRRNGFNDRLIFHIKEKVERGLSVVSPQPEKPKTVYWKLPYFQENEKILNSKLKSVNNLLQKVQIKPVFSTLKTRNLFKNKDSIPSGLSSNVVYEYKCDRCAVRYIGETKRHLNTRIHEHLKAIPVPSEISLHHHPLKKENFFIVSRSSNIRFAETILIDFYRKKDFPLLNEKDSSVPLTLKL